MIGPLYEPFRWSAQSKPREESDVPWLPIEHFPEESLGQILHVVSTSHPLKPNHCCVNPYNTTLAITPGPTQLWGRTIKWSGTLSLCIQ